MHADTLPPDARLAKTDKGRQALTRRELLPVLPLRTALILCDGRACVAEVLGACRALGVTAQDLAGLVAEQFVEVRP